MGTPVLGLVFMVKGGGGTAQNKDAQPEYQ